GSEPPSPRGGDREADLTITIDGRRFTDFEGFVAEAKEAFSGKVDWLWNGNLDAFDTLLDEVEGRYGLVWPRADLSRHCLGHQSMIRWRAGSIQRCHPDNIMAVAERLRLARLGQGPTLFDWLVEIIRGHGQVELFLGDGPA